jgi:hypothetical protein
MVNKDWALVRVLHSLLTGIPPDVVDYIAVSKVLQGCVSGLSNQTIAKSFEMDEDYVRKVLEKFFSFEGWKWDLSINPILIYGRVFGIEEDFYDKLFPHMDEGMIDIAYKLCLIYRKI